MSRWANGSALTWLGIAISIASVAGVIWWATSQEPPSLPGTAGELAALGASIALYALNTALRAERWRFILIRSDAPTRRRDAYGLTTVGYMGNNVLPARAGDIMRIVLMAPRAGTSKRGVVGSLFAERVLDVAIIVPLFAVLAATLADAVELPTLSTPLAFALATSLAGALLAALAFVYFQPQLIARLRAFARPISRALVELASRHGALMVGLSAIIWVVEVAVWWAAAGAAGLTLGALDAFYLVALAGIFSLIPSGPGYAGTQDTAIIIGAKAVGASGAAALSYLLMIRFILLVPITLVGLVVLLAGYGGFDRLGRRRVEAASP